MHAATMINMGESFTLTVNGADVTMEGVYAAPYSNARVGNAEFEQLDPAMVVSTACLAELINQPTEDGNSTITRNGGMPKTIFKVKPMEGGRTRLEVRSY